MQRASIDTTKNTYFERAEGKHSLGMYLKPSEEEVQNRGVSVTDRTNVLQKIYKTK